MQTERDSPVHGAPHQSSLHDVLLAVMVALRRPSAYRTLPPDEALRSVAEDTADLFTGVGEILGERRAALAPPVFAALAREFDSGAELFTPTIALAGELDALLLRLGRLTADFRALAEGKSSLGSDREEAALRQWLAFYPPEHLGTGAEPPE